MAVKIHMNVWWVRVRGDMRIKVVYVSASRQIMTCTLFIHFFIPLMLNDAYTTSQGAGFSSQMTQHVSVNCEHSCTALVSFSLFLLPSLLSLSVCLFLGGGGGGCKS